MSISYRDIADFSGYVVGSDGRVWSNRQSKRVNKHGIRIKPKWKQLKPNRNPGRKRNTRYSKVKLYRNDGRSYTKAVHRLVLEAFVGPCPIDCEVRHLDGDETNNNLYNLRWGTRLENYNDRRIHGTESYGEKSGKAKLKTHEVLRIVQLKREGFTTQQIIQMFNTPKATIQGILRGTRRQRETGIIYVSQRQQ